jgi:hypothetical protein
VRLQLCDSDGSLNYKLHTFGDFSFKEKNKINNQELVTEKQDSGPVLHSISVVLLFIRKPSTESRGTQGTN